MSREKKVFLLDAMALIYRAHFAFIRNPRYNSDGLNTSAIFGFTNSLTEVLEKEKPSHIAVVSDSDKPTFRHKEYEAYKAGREEMPESIIAARPYIEKIIEAFNIPYIIKDGYEADDIIGTLAKQASEAGYKVYMMTPDKDFCQLVTDKVLLYKPATGKQSKQILDQEKVLQKWGIKDTDQIRDILGLMGDASDNIPGVPGIGEKRAQSLIAEYGTIENLLKHTDQLKGKIKETLKDNADKALSSKKLVTIDVNSPVTFDPESLKYNGPNTQKLEELFQELEFQTLGKRILGEHFVLKNSANTADNDVDQAKQSTIENTDINYRLLSDADSIKSYAKQLQEAPAFSFDTETTGIDPHTCELVGISFAFEKNEAAYIPVNTPEVNKKDILEWLKPAFESPDIEKTGHNLKYDITVLANQGIHVQGNLFDTMIAHFLLEPDTRHNLNVLSERYLNYSPVSIEKLIGNKGKGQKSMDELKPEEISDYACEDADLAWQLSRIFKKELKKAEADNLYYKAEGPLIHVLAHMEMHGVYIDQDALADLSGELGKEMDKLEKQIYETAGKTFNINSPKQLGDIMFEKMQLDPNAKKLPKSGQYSTNEEVLKKLANQFEFPGLVLDYRSLQKLKSTYVDALPKLVNPATGRLHTTLNQAVTATGRLSSTNPNLQNIPIRTEKGREIRKAFAVQNPEDYIYCADYSQIELRLMAEFSGDEGLMDAFRNNKDIHASTAAKIFGIDEAEVTQDMRRSAKTVNFGIIYGISAFGLSERMGIPRKEAGEIIKTYFEKYPGVKAYMDKEIAFAKEHGYVKTLLGRRRYLPDINSRNHTTRGYAERNAINTPIQGTAAEMIKLAMIEIDRELKEKNYQSRMILQVHDELIFEVPSREMDAIEGMVTKQMKNALKLEVPVVVEGGKGKNWLEAH